jgi:predicted TPR repeat methyltransferase
METSTTASREPEADPQGREVTVKEAMAMAIAFQQRGQREQAAEVLAKILAVAPDYPDALHLQGMLAHELGLAEDAVALMRRSLVAEPDRADWHSNLGVVLKDLGRLDDAIAAYERAISLAPDHVNAHSNLGVLLRAQGRLAEAEAAYRRAVHIDPNHVQSYHNLGVLLSQVGRTKEAVWCYCKVTTLRPQHEEARQLLAMAYTTLGEREKAIELLETWVDDDPENPVAQHMLMSVSGRNTPDRASDAFVEKVFDAFAESFDEKLERLSYRAPQLVAAVLQDSGLPATKGLDVLDAGCGTGLCGPLVAPYARTLEGVDLSSKMLEKAQGRGYDRLVKSELVAFLAQATARYDLIVSADTLVYFGALEAAFSAASGALRPGGELIFSLEEETEPGDTDSFRLMHHGRYTHRQEYVERTLRAVGLEPTIVHAELRMESGAPVAGMVVRATKTLDEVSHG